MSAQHILVTQTGPIRRITLNRPDKANALTTAMMRTIAHAVGSAAADGIGLIVFAGTAPKGFSAGADLTEISQGEEHLKAQEHALLAMIRTLAASPVPSLAVIRGYTLGGGCLLTALADMVIAADDLSFGLPEIKFNMYPAIVHAVLMQKAPSAQVGQLCASGRLLGAQEAQAMGFVSEVLPAAEFAEAAEERLAFYGERIAALSIGRRAALRMMPPADLEHRVNALAPLLLDNYRLPGVKDTVAAVLRR